VNNSTILSDCDENGHGAKIVISTYKRNAPGPFELEALTTQKFVVLGHGEVRT